MVEVTSVNPRLNPNVRLLVTFLEGNTIQHQTLRKENKIFLGKTQKGECGKVVSLVTAHHLLE